MDIYISDREAAHIYGGTVDQIRQFDEAGQLPNSRRLRGNLEIRLADLYQLS